jgi:hypothetical protein
VRATFSNAADRVEVTVNGERGTELLVGTGPGESIRVRIPLLCVTRRGPRARFAAAIDPSVGETPGEVEDVTITDHVTSGTLIRVRLRDRSEEIYAYGPAGNARTVEGRQTRSKLLCLRREAGGETRVLAEAR